MLVRVHLLLLLLSLLPLFLLPESVGVGGIAELMVELFDEFEILDIIGMDFLKSSCGQFFAF